MAPAPSRAELKKNLKALHTILGVRPLDLDARMRIARTYRLLAQGKKAVGHYRAVARYLALSGHPAQAIGVLQELLQVDPQHEETLLFLAKLYARTSRGSADQSGRIAVPISEAEPALAGHQDPFALQHGMPETGTGVWNAIRPQHAEPTEVIHDPDELGAEIIEDDIESFAEPTEGSTGDNFEILGPLTTGDLLLPQVSLFSTLSAEAFVALGQRLRIVHHREGDALFTQGERANACYIIKRGRVSIEKEDRDGTTIPVVELREGDVAGIFALKNEGTRQASALCATDVETYQFTTDDVVDLAIEHPSFRAAIDAFFRERLVLNLLAQMPTVKRLAPDARHDLASSFVERRYGKDDELFYEGDERDGLWVITAGAAEVLAGSGRATSLSRGHFLGLFASLREGGADARCVARAATEAMLLPKARLDELFEGQAGKDQTRQSFAERDMMVSDVTFVGDVRVPARAGPVQKAS